MNTPMQDIPLKIKKDDNYIFKITIRGTAPLLTDRCPLISTNGTPAPKLDPEEKFKISYYTLPSQNGHIAYGFPASGIKAAAVSAARLIQGMQMVKVRGMFFVSAENDGLVSIVHPYGSVLEPVIDIQNVHLKDGKTVPAICARFDEWQITFTVSYYRSIAKYDNILQLYFVAGTSVGLGRRRPERSGLDTYGTFDVIDVPENPEK